MTEYILFKQKFNQILLLLAVGWITAAVPLALGQMFATRLAPAPAMISTLKPSPLWQALISLSSTVPEAAARMLRTRARNAGERHRFGGRCAGGEQSMDLWSGFDTAEQKRRRPTIWSDA